MDHAGEIAAVLGSLGVDEFAIFAGPDGSYVQVIVLTPEGDADCEAVDLDQWNVGAGRMTPAGRARLEEMGFERQDGGNYVMEARLCDTQEVHRVAGLLARVLHDVYGVRADEALEVTVDS